VRTERDPSRAGLTNPATHSSTLGTADANKSRSLNKKIFLCWVFLIVAFVLVAMFKNTALNFAFFISEYVPAVKKQIDKGTNEGNFAGSYFAQIFLFTPLLALMSTWKEDFYRKMLIASEKAGRTSLQSMLLVYFVSGPFSIFVLLIMYFAPFGSFDAPQLAGQHIATLMTGTSLGLLIFGSIAGVGGVIFCMILFAVVQISIRCLRGFGR
jgi:hypothetical protein